MYVHACVLTPPVSFVFQDLGQHNRPAKISSKKMKKSDERQSKKYFFRGEKSQKERVREKK